VNLASAWLQSSGKKVCESSVLMERSGGLLDLDSITEAEKTKEGGSQEDWHVALANVACNAGLYARYGDQQFVAAVLLQKFVDIHDVEDLTDHLENKQVFQIAAVEKTVSVQMHHENSTNPDAHQSADYLLQGQVRSSEKENGRTSRFSDQKGEGAAGSGVNFADYVAN